MLASETDGTRRRQRLRPLACGACWGSSPVRRPRAGHSREEAAASQGAGWHARCGTLRPPASDDSARVPVAPRKGGARAETSLPALGSKGSRHPPPRPRHPLPSQTRALHVLARVGPTSVPVEDSGHTCLEEQTETRQRQNKTTHKTKTKRKETNKKKRFFFNYQSERFNPQRVSVLSLWEPDT